MILIENTEVHGWEAAIRGMRNPMNSWDKSDSEDCENYTILSEKIATLTKTEKTPNGISLFTDADKTEYKNTVQVLREISEIYKELSDKNQEKLLKTMCDMDYCVGDNDLNLMKKLVKAGTDHSKFMRMINVTCDITAPLYWWKEFDTYKVGTVRNSCSTMHKIHDKEFTLDDFSHEHLFSVREVELGATIPLNFLEHICIVLNECRKQYLKTNDKQWWWQMIQLLPSSYNQRATVQTNYQVLRNMYHSRKPHKLDEWRNFCCWVDELPYSELITGCVEK